MHQGLLVTEVMGQGVNIVTGDYPRRVWVAEMLDNNPIVLALLIDAAAGGQSRQGKIFVNKFKHFTV